ncbi:hypothetical protein [Promicromonospora soli]|uniref:Uncharacterized protein n=1 Tax=Promicromonospora soli TaxID=2035533 RepID=A0A919FJN2_9MICO|nr:hypothetical protein [Promicromonospora soli]GHH66511.1 hypothetical protein GCM10017772_06550 [Promicromonospora soli]
MIVFLDVDGTLLPLGPGDRSQAVDDPRAWRAQSNPQLGKLRRAPSYDLVRLGAELVWATTWGQDANDVVAPILVLGRMPVVDFEEDDDLPVPSVPRKLRAASVFTRAPGGETTRWGVSHG